METEEDLIIIDEGKVHVMVLPGTHAPEKTTGFYNPKMRMNRTISVLTLASVVEPHWEVLDAFGSTGVLGLRWCVEVLGYPRPSDGEKKNVAFRGRVVVNDIDRTVVNLAKRNAELNGLEVLGRPAFGSNDYDLVPLSAAAPLELTCENANVLMHQRCWDFIQLDPFGANAPFLDAATVNIRNGGVISMTCTDISALYGLYPQVAKRHYAGVTSRKVFFYREMGARVVLGALARAFAVHHKGMKVLSVISREHYVHVVVRVLRGLGHADASLNAIGCVYVGPAHSSCFSLEPLDGVAEEAVGPCWLGPVMCPDFVGELHSRALASVSHKSEKKLLQLLHTLRAEAQVEAVFYYNTEDVCRGLPNLPKKANVIEWATADGFQASRTHFSGNGIRTTASFDQLRALCRTRVLAT